MPRHSKRKPSDGLTAHVIRNQVEPQVFAAEMHMRGVQVDTALVSTDPQAEGFEISCWNCGSTARVPVELPKGKAAMCPECVRKVNRRSEA